MPGISLLLDLWHPEGGGQPVFCLVLFFSGLHPHALPVVTLWLMLFILSWSGLRSQQESANKLFTQFPIIIHFGDTGVLKDLLYSPSFQTQAVQAGSIFMLTACMQRAASALQVLYCFSGIGAPEMAQLRYVMIPHRITDQAAISNDKCAAVIFEASRKTSQESSALSSLVDSQLLTPLLCWSAKVLGGIC